MDAARMLGRAISVIFTSIESSLFLISKTQILKISGVTRVLSQGENLTEKDSLAIGGVLLAQHSEKMW